MRRSYGPNLSLARRAAVASMTVLAASGVGLVAAPALGQIVIPIGGPIGGTSQSAGVTNAGSASANTGGNTAIGNNSTNTASATVAGGAVNVPVNLGAGPTNTSEGSAAVTTGPASAVGNSADTGVRQSTASGTTVNRFLSAQNQGAGVENVGSASANTGGNTAIGNNSTNTATVAPNVAGGLVGVAVGVGGPTNNSTGSATINSGPAGAIGNNSTAGISQANTTGGAGGGPFGGPGGPGGPGGGFIVGAGGGPGGGPGGPGVRALGGIGGAGIGPAPCNTGRFLSFQEVDVVNRGDARANTGNNVAIGNASTNDASVTVPQTVSGGLLGVGVTIGGPVNNSSGTAVITTGPATAVGNNAATTVSQVEGCPQVATLAGGGPGRGPVFIGSPPGRVGVVQQVVRPAVLARTGLESSDLGMIAGALLGGGMLLVASQRRRLAARHAAVPMAGFGLGLGANDWDRAVR